MLPPAIRTIPLLALLGAGVTGAFAYPPAPTDGAELTRTGAPDRARSRAPYRAPHRVRIETEKGNIEVEIDVDSAPATAENFMYYVDGGFYEGGRFHRTVHDDNQPNNEFLIDVIQAGIDPERRGQGRPAIALERTRDTGLKHLAGSISMARSGPDSATSDFFICVEDEPELDFGGRRNADGQGFAAFGRVTSGMDLVRAIQRSPADGQILNPPIRILRIVRID
jgi:peptidyl-prolyl cis-trans isomerase A (cyclophilin A)